MRFFPAASLLTASLVATFLAAPSLTARGQTTTSTADQGIRLQSYALATYQKPDFSSYGQNQAGGTIGANLNIAHFGRFQPSLDARASGNFGPVDTAFLGGGPRLVLDAGRFHPYADYLVGFGAIHFTSGTAYTHDTSFVTSLGGGVDFSLNPRWAIRADVQRQNWNVDARSSSFHPVQAGVGIRYQFHFRNRNGPE